ncbi:uncharacterized protein LOC124926927 [Impatiens glandulifera]|uniref:uncharacterized protein LOC124926927 n=1 Tax=Impatiens glandulifera TaxID=253017 RepID=UPI001FB109EE|nr:uncharacterized protein LOC124926927 [Impatiens glandulifera]
MIKKSPPSLQKPAPEVDLDDSLVQPDAVEELAISLHALTGSKTFQMLQILGKLYQANMKVLTMTGYDIVLGIECLSIIISDSSTLQHTAANNVNPIHEWWERGKLLGSGGFGMVSEARPLPGTPLFDHLPQLMAVKSSLTANLSALRNKCCPNSKIHKSGVIHCDIKPENILIADDRVPKIADFGLAMKGRE